MHDLVPVVHALSPLDPRRTVEDALLHILDAIDHALHARVHQRCKQIGRDGTEGRAQDDRVGGADVG